MLNAGLNNTEDRMWARSFKSNFRSRDGFLRAVAPRRVQISDARSADERWDTLITNHPNRNRNRDKGKDRRKGNRDKHSLYKVRIAPIGVTIAATIIAITPAVIAPAVIAATVILDIGYLI